MKDRGRTGRFTVLPVWQALRFRVSEEPTVSKLVKFTAARSLKGERFFFFAGEVFAKEISWVFFLVGEVFALFLGAGYNFKSRFL